MSSWILPMKVILISAGVVSLAVGLKFSVPIAVNGLPAIWSIVLSWMKPPYLYLIINGIIITIAASSRFHQSQTEPSQPAAVAAAVRTEHLISARIPAAETFESLSVRPDISTSVEEPAAVRSEHLISSGIPMAENFESLSARSDIFTAVEEPAAAGSVVPEIEDREVELKPVMVNGSKVDIMTEEDNLGRTEAVEVGGIFVDSSMIAYNKRPQEISSPELQFESLFPAREKPLTSSRFVNRKPNRSVRSIPEVPGVKALRVAKPKKQETLESTWKMITEGRHVPLTRHLKKSDTWEHHAPPTVHNVPKSETFKERSNYQSPPAKIRKEPSLGQDELNRRVEAFIHKFNEDMRMQRQESMNQFMEMINRGV